MKTFLFENGEHQVSVKADVFATNAELLTPGFDTRFTAMEISDTDAAIALGLNVNEKEYDVQGFIALAKAIAGTTLSVSDYSKPQIGTIQKTAVQLDGTDITAVAQEVEVTLTGTSGTANIVIGEDEYLATFNASLATTAGDFVTDHAATILSENDIVITNPSGAVLLFVANTAGVPFELSVESLTGDLDGTIDETVANVSVGKVAVTIDGTSYEVEFDTDLEVTGDAFVTAHAANILTNHGVVVTHPDDDGNLIFTTNTSETSFNLSTETLVEDLAGIIEIIVNQDGSLIRLV